MLKRGEIALVFLIGAYVGLVMSKLTYPNYLDKLTDPLTIFTLVLAASTVGLWLANLRQLALTRDALSLNREDLAARSGVANQDLLSRVNTMLKEDPSLFKLQEIDPNKALKEHQRLNSYIFMRICTLVC
jgi:hypothetical protein